MKNKRKNLIISILLIFTLIFSLSSFTITAHAAENQTREIVVYNIYGAKYVDSDYLAEIGLYKTYFRNPVLTVTATDVYESNQENVYEGGYIIFNYGSVDAGQIDGLTYIRGLDINLNYEGESWLMIYEMVYVPRENPSNIINRNLYFYYTTFSNASFDLRRLYIMNELPFPNDNLNSEYMYLCTSLNIYQGNSQTNFTMPTDLYPAAQAFVDGLGNEFYSFTIDNIFIYDEEYFFGDMWYPNTGEENFQISGLINDKSEYLITENYNGESFIYEGGVYYFKNNLNSFTSFLNLVENAEETPFISGGIEFNNFLNYNNQLLYDEILAYNNGWQQQAFRLISFENSKYTDFDDIYTSGLGSAIYFRNNALQMVKTREIVGPARPVTPETDIIADIIDGLGELIGNSFVSFVTFFDRLTNTLFGFVENTGKFFNSFANNPIQYTALGIIVIIIIVLIFIFTRRN